MVVESRKDLLQIPIWEFSRFDSNQFKLYESNLKMQQVLFWSKYSSSCKQLLGEMKSYGAMIDTVCVDNPKIRKRIATNPKLQITVVPTLLSIYQNGVVEKYEGEKVFQLLYEAFSKPERVEPKVVKETKTIVADETPREISQPREIVSEISQPREIVSEISQPREIVSEISQPPTTSSETLVTKPTSDSKQELTSLDDLGGEELFEVDKDDSKKSENSGDPKRTSKNLPVKPPSKLAAQAAAIAAAREAHDSKQPRPNGNIIPR